MWAKIMRTISERYQPHFKSATWERNWKASTSASSAKSETKSKAALKKPFLRIILKSSRPLLLQINTRFLPFHPALLLNKGSMLLLHCLLCHPWLKISLLSLILQTAPVALNFCSINLLRTLFSFLQQGLWILWSQVTKCSALLSVIPQSTQLSTSIN